jgi:hypothetical protein
MSETVSVKASFGMAGLPSADSLAAAFRNVKNEVGTGGVNILKMDKAGCFVYGANNVEVEKGSEWAVNPFSFIHGHIAWGEGEVLGEHMTPIQKPLIEPGYPPDGAKRGWEYQLGFMLIGLGGLDDGVELRYTATSIGGKKAIQILSDSLAGQIAEDIEHPVPVITMHSESYIHRKYGKTFNPIFKIAGWVGIEGLNAASEEAIEDDYSGEEAEYTDIKLIEAPKEPAPEAAPRGRDAARTPEAAPRGRDAARTPEAAPRGRDAARTPEAAPRGRDAARTPEAAPAPEATARRRPRG